MPIKQLQLRGISRTPSDRGTVDGGCAESLNVHLDQQETAPTLPPDDISESIYGEDTRYPIVYIHKMPGVKNYIGYMGSTTHGFYAYGDTVTSGTMGGLVIPSGETFKHMASVGNTLIAYTDKTPYYFLFKEGSYHFLGTSIPRPLLEIVTRWLTTWQEEASIDIPDETLRTAKQEGTQHPDIEKWNSAKADGDENHAGLLQTITAAWEQIALILDEKREDGIFSAPFFIRYALRLYDGNYIHLSTPILCGADEKQGLDWATAYIGDEYWNNVDYVGFKLWVTLSKLFNVHVKGSFTVGDWKDIVSSIDIFASTPIYTPNVNAPLFSVASTATDHFTFNEYLQVRSGYTVTFDGMQEGTKNDTIKSEILSKGQFYLIKSIDLQNATEMGKLTDGTMVIENSDEIGPDGLVVKEELPDGYRDGVEYVPAAGTENFNSRVMLVGASERLSRGDELLNSHAAGKYTATDKSAEWFLLRYKLVNSVTGDVNYVYANYKDGSRHLRPSYLSGNDSDGYVQHFGDETTTDSVLNATTFGWLAYPDTRCTQVEVFYSITSDIVAGGKIIPMEKHPLLECSFAFLGFGYELADIINDANYANAPAADVDAVENLYMSAKNKLFLSDFQNPFLFPAGNIITFPDELIGVGLTSAPLSEGQVGDFDVYVFTEGGIRVLKTNSQGTFSINTAYPTNLSRHIALPGTITSLEQAIVFITERGVMMLVGGSVTELSASMNGKPYALDEDIVTILEGTEWGELLEAATGEETLMGFMRTAKVAYDNNGSRLVFFNPTRGYQYVYMLQTQTWHKILTGVLAPTVLNSYPECLVAHQQDGAWVKNFSTILDDDELLADTNDVKGLIVTRPFDLGEPDIRKAITSLRIRGRYNRDDVRYILMGSFDGIHWDRMRSLRGGSYKQFRLAVLCDLAPTERITWVDVEYEDRFTNKLR